MSFLLLLLLLLLLLYATNTAVPCHQITHPMRQTQQQGRSSVVMRMSGFPVEEVTGEQLLPAGVATTQLRRQARLAAAGRAVDHQHSQRTFRRRPLTCHAVSAEPLLHSLHQ